MLEQSWSQVLDKAQELPERRGSLPALPCKSCRKALRNHPLPQGSPRGWCHLPLPALLSQLQQQQAGLRGRGRGKGAPGFCGAPWINGAPFPGRDYHREMQQFLISGGTRSSGLGSCMDSNSTGSQHLDPTQPSCLLPHRQRDSAEGRERPRNIQGCARKIPAVPPTSESDLLRDPAPASCHIPNPRVHLLGLSV